MDKDDVVTHVRSSLPKAFGEELTDMENPVNILDIKEEAEICSPEQEPNEPDSSPRLLAALITCANLQADYDESESEECHAYREAIAAISEATGKAE